MEIKIGQGSDTYSNYYGENLYNSNIQQLPSESGDLYDQDV
jgi:hypothetical protein